MRSVHCKLEVFYIEGYKSNACCTRAERKPLFCVEKSRRSMGQRGTKEQLFVLKEVICLYESEDKKLDLVHLQQVLQRFCQAFPLYAAVASMVCRLLPLNQYIVYNSKMVGDMRCVER